MPKFITSLLLAGCFALGGCAAGIGQDPLTGILGSVLGGGGAYGSPGSAGTSFERAAVDACGSYASRYGRVSITNVRQNSRTALTVYGTIDDGRYQPRGFTCSFTSDGRIGDFRIG